MTRVAVIKDDLTGDDLTGKDGTLRKISVDGKTFEIDLSDRSVEALTEMLSGQGTAGLAKLLGTTQTGTSRSRRAGGQRKPGTGESTQARQWAREHPEGKAWANAHPDVHIGDEGSARGRANADLLEAFRGFQRKQTGATGPAVSPPAPAASAPKTEPAAHDPKTGMKAPAA